MVDLSLVERLTFRIEISLAMFSEHIKIASYLFPFRTTSSASQHTLFGNVLGLLDSGQF